MDEWIDKYKCYTKATDDPQEDYFHCKDKPDAKSERVKEGPASKELRKFFQLV